MSDYANLLDRLRQPTRELRRAAPEPWGAFGKLHDAAMADGVLPARIKELIALTIDGCIAYHAKAAARAGATPEEVAEALALAVVMDGGPTASSYGPRAWQAYEEFAAGEESSDDAAVLSVVEGR